MLLAADATNHLPLVDVDVETPPKLVSGLARLVNSLRSRDRA